jgi:hypothetical protein
MKKSQRRGQPAKSDRGPAKPVNSSAPKLQASIPRFDDRPASPRKGKANGGNESNPHLPRFDDRPPKSRAAESGLPHYGDREADDPRRIDIDDDDLLAS